MSRTAYEMIADYVLQVGGTMTVRSVSDDLGLGYESAKKAFRRLVREDRVVCIGKSGSRKVYARNRKPVQSAQDLRQSILDALSNGAQTRDELIVSINPAVKSLLEAIDAAERDGVIVRTEHVCRYMVDDTTSRANHDYFIYQTVKQGMSRRDAKKWLRAHYGRERYGELSMSEQKDAVERLRGGGQ